MAWRGMVRQHGGNVARFPLLGADWQGVQCDWVQDCAQEKWSGTSLLRHFFFKGAGKNFARGPFCAAAFVIRCRLAFFFLFPCSGADKRLTQRATKNRKLHPPLPTARSSSLRRDTGTLYSKHAQYKTMEINAQHYPTQSYWITEPMANQSIDREPETTVEIHTKRNELGKFRYSAYLSCAV